MPLPAQAVGSFETEQAAADHHRVAARPAGLHHAADIGDVAEADDAVQVCTGKRQHDGIGAGGEHQHVVAPLRSVRAAHRAAARSIADRRLTGDQLDCRSSYQSRS